MNSFITTKYKIKYRMTKLCKINLKQRMNGDSIILLQYLKMYLWKKIIENNSIFSTIMKKKYVKKCHFNAFC